MQFVVNEFLDYPLLNALNFYNRK